MSNQTRTKSKERAKYLKEHHVERTSGMCPWGCGRSLTNGGTALLNHLRTCQGKVRKYSV